LDYFNPVTKILMEKNLSSEDAVKDIYKIHSRKFKLRKIVWNTARFTSVKLGYDQTEYLRKIICEYFDLTDDELPRKNKQKKVKKKRKVKFCR